MIHTQLMQWGSLQVMYVYRATDTMKADFIGLTIAKPFFDSAVGHSHGKSIPLMVAAIVVSPGASFHHRVTTKFSSPDYQRFIQ